jgi:hypothetical protein
MRGVATKWETVERLGVTVLASGGLLLFAMKVTQLGGGCVRLLIREPGGNGTVQEGGGCASRSGTGATYGKG